MGKLKNAHDHALTQWLKVIIFGIVMLAPFFAILSKCCYVAFNKNAYESYSGTETQYKVNEYETNEVTTVSDLIVGNVYELQFNPQNQLNVATTYYIGSTENFDFSIFYPTLNLQNYTQTLYCYIYVVVSNNTSVIFQLNRVQDPNTSNRVLVFGTETYFENELVKIQFIYKGGLPNNYEYINYIKETTITNIPKTYEKVETTNLDNVFEYAVSQLGEKPIFAWTKNTGIYTTINNMTTGLGFNTDNNTLAILLTYWTLNTAIYIVFDIIIVLFVKLTHFISEK